LTSKIINMAEKLKDAEDRLLESLFAAEPIADEGFSGRVVTRIRRRLWIRRLALPVAILVGGSVAAKPLAELTLAASKLLAVMPQDLLAIPTDWLPQVQLIVVGAMLLGAGSLGLRLLED
jgi:hypothetical protein